MKAVKNKTKRVSLQGLVFDGLYREFQALNLGAVVS